MNCVIVPEDHRARANWNHFLGMVSENVEHLLYAFDKGSDGKEEHLTESSDLG